MRRPASTAPLAQEFERLYGIRVVVSRGGPTATVIDRILAEQSAGRYTVDLGWLIQIEPNQRLVPNNALDAVGPLLIHPEVTDMSFWYGGKHWYGDVIPGGQHLFLYTAAVETHHSYWYNTNLVSPPDIAAIRGFEDFLDPKWRGKLAGLAPSVDFGLAGYANVYTDYSNGPQWVRRYFTEMGVTWTEDRPTLGDWLARGRFAMAPVLAEAGTGLAELSREGLPVAEAQFPLEQPALMSSGSGSAIAVFRNAPHPNATKFFLNWFLSREGQTVLHETVKDLDRQSLREDVPLGNVTDRSRREPGKEYYFRSADPKILAIQVEARPIVKEMWQGLRR